LDDWKTKEWPPSKKASQEKGIWLAMMSEFFGGFSKNAACRPPCFADFA